MVEEQLEALKTAIENEDKEQVTETFEDVAAAFGQRRQRSEALNTLARNIRDYEADGSDPVKQAEAYFTRSLEASQQRIELNQVILSYITESVDKTEAIEVIDTTLAAESELTESMKTVSSVETDVDLPPALAIEGFEDLEIPKETEVTETITINNYGHSAARDVTLTLESGLNVELTETSVAEIPAEDSITVNIIGTPASTGEHTLVLEVAGEVVRTSREVTVVVADRSEYLVAAQEQVDDLLALVRDFKDENGTSKSDDGGGGLNGIENKLATADKRIGHLLDAIDDGDDPDEVADRINALQNLVGTIPQHARGIRGVHITEGEAALLIADAKAINGTLDSAIDAKQ